MKKIVLLFVVMLMHSYANGQRIIKDKVDQFDGIRTQKTSTELIGATGERVWQSISAYLLRSQKDSAVTFTLMLLVKDVSTFTIKKDSYLTILFDSGQKLSLKCTANVAALHGDPEWKADVPFELPKKELTVLAKNDIKAIRISVNMNENEIAENKDVEAVKFANKDVFERLIALFDEQ